jgi:hypothetical protein
VSIDNKYSIFNQQCSINIMKERIRLDRQPANIPIISNPLLARSIQPQPKVVAATNTSVSSHNLSRIAPFYQAKLSVSQPGDAYEREADTIAQKVMKMDGSSLQQQTQHQEEELVQTKPVSELINPLVQREELPEEEELQMKPEIQTAAHNEGASEDISSKLHSRKGGGSPLTDDVRSFMEPRFGADFSNVKVHTDGEAVQMAGNVGAQAFAYGSDVYFGAGKSPGNNELTAHELTHVVQQTGGLQRKSPAEKIQTKPLATDITPFAQQDARSNILLQLKSQKIDDAVKKFKDVVTPKNEKKGSPTLVESGQFYWTSQIQSAITEYINGLRFIPAVPEWGTLLDRCQKTCNKDFGGDAKDIQAIRETIASIRKRASQGGLTEATLLPLLLLVEPLLKTAQKSGKDLYYELWYSLNQTDKVPNLDPYRSIPTLQAIWAWENQACGYTGSMVSQRYLKRKGGASKRDKKKQAWANFGSNAERDMRPAHNPFRRGDVLSQSGVSGAIPKMQAALDNGWILQAHVLSGIGVGEDGAVKAYDKQVDRELAGGKKATKQPERVSASGEHWISIIGYDNNEFVFWDPDSSSSNRNGSGFGSLFFQGDKLSTAENDADMTIGINGDHRNGNHRYQVITISSQ